MKSLCLVRHARAGWKSGVASDFERPLDPQGREDAALMARRLRDYAFWPEVLVASPATRTRETAAIFAQALGCSAANIAFDEEIYSTDLEGLVTILRGLQEDSARALMVGHNPFITILAEWLSGERLHTIPPCGLVALEFPDLISWQEIAPARGRMLFYDHPGKQ